MKAIAFLRGLNVGGHTVKMADLRAVFADMGFEDVATFIASGNVILGGEPGDAAELERRIEAGLREALGYDVATFVRTCEELASVAAPERLGDSPLVDDDRLTVNVSFLKGPAPEPLRAMVAELGTPDDEFVVKGREVYWLRRGRMSESTVWRPYEKALAGVATTRNMNTVRRIHSKFC